MSGNPGGENENLVKYQWHDEMGTWCLQEFVDGEWVFKIPLEKITDDLLKEAFMADMGFGMRGSYRYYESEEEWRKAWHGYAWHSSVNTLCLQEKIGDEWKFIWPLKIIPEDLIDVLLDGEGFDVHEAPDGDEDDELPSELKEMSGKVIDVLCPKCGEVKVEVEGVNVFEDGYMLLWRCKCGKLGSSEVTPNPYVEMK